LYFLSKQTTEQAVKAVVQVGGQQKSTQTIRNFMLHGAVLHQRYPEAVDIGLSDCRQACGEGVGV